MPLSLTHLTVEGLAYQTHHIGQFFHGAKTHLYIAITPPANVRDIATQTFGVFDVINA